jgi:hypothetical protein
LKALALIAGALALVGALATTPASAGQPLCEAVGFAAKDVARMDNRNEITPAIAGDLMDLGKAGRTTFSSWNAMLPTRDKLNRSGDWPPFWTWSDADLAAVAEQFRSCGRKERKDHAARKAAGKWVPAAKTERFFKGAEKLEAFHAAVQRMKQNRADLEARVEAIAAAGEPTVAGFGAMVDEAMSVVRAEGVGRGFARRQAKAVLEAAETQSETLAERVRADVETLSDLGALKALQTQGEAYAKHRDRLRKASLGRGPFARMRGAMGAAAPAHAAFSAVRREGENRLAVNLANRLEGDLSGASPAERMRKYNVIYAALPAEIAERAPNVEKRYKRVVADRYFDARDEIEEARCEVAKAELDALRDAPVVVGNKVRKFEAFVCDLAGSGFDVAYDGDGPRLTLTPGEYGVDVGDSGLEPFDEMVVEFEMQSMSRGMALVGTAFEVDGDRKEIEKAGWWRLAGQLREVDLGI